MARVSTALVSFNRGEVSRDALARVDIERLRLSAEIQENWMPFTLGPMTLRPGLAYVGETSGGQRARFAPFVFSIADTALLEFTDSRLRIWDGDALRTRADIGNFVTSGDFSAATGWTLTTTGLGAVASITGGVLTLASPAIGGLAQAKQEVTITDVGIRHAVRVVVTRGPVTFRAGSTDGDDDYIRQTTLDTGVHSLAFTPSGNVFIQVETTTARSKIIDSIQFEDVGFLQLPTPWAVNDLPKLRFAQSGDVVFIACYGQKPKKIERRAADSWSLADYIVDDGPFGSGNIGDTTLTPGAIGGNTTLTASRPMFRTSHVGALFRLFSSGQNAQASLAAENTFSTAVRVTGVDSARVFSIDISGTWTGTLTLQRSFDGADTGFTDVSGETYTVNTTKTFDDGLDNSIVWYRIGFKTGDYSADTAVVSLSYSSGGAAGICRVTAFTSKTVVDIEILSPFSSLTATEDWNEGDWSAVKGYPSAVAFYDGRLWWAGRDKIWGSVSDAFTSFDMNFEGDAGTINRSLGSGPVDTINWLLPLARMIVGREGSEGCIRSSSFDEPLTPTNFSIKDCSTQGSAQMEAAKVDTRGVFVQQSDRRVYELAFNVEVQDYATRDLTRLNSEIGSTGFVSIAVQRQPDTIIHFVLGSGEVASLVYDKDDQVEAWWRTVTDGLIEDVVILPGQMEDKVYFSVNRNGTRNLERMARRDQCSGLPEARLADAHINYSAGETTTISGLDHLEGRMVSCWGWNTITPFTVELPDGSAATVGRDLGLFQVEGGAISGLPSAVTNACVGLPYTALFKSAKLAYGAMRGTALNQKKRIEKLGLILLNTHHQGLVYGQSLSGGLMDDLPSVEEGATVNDGVIWETFDSPEFSLNGTWTSDSRLCLKAASPKPCTVMAAVVSIATHESG